MRRTTAAAALVLAVGCSGGSPADDGATPTAGPDAVRLTVTSPVFEDGAPIPVEHSCDGEDTMPPLSWSAPPPGTASLAVTVEDPDAPHGTFTHLAIAGLPPDLDHLGAELPEDAIVGTNDFGRAGWAGPCPPPDDGPHRYRFTVTALDEELELEPGFSPSNLADVAAGAVTAQGTLTGSFER